METKYSKPEIESIKLKKEKRVYQTTNKPDIDYDAIIDEKIKDIQKRELTISNL